MCRFSCTVNRSDAISFSQKQSIKISLPITCLLSEKANLFLMIYIFEQGFLKVSRH